MNWIPPIVNVVTVSVNANPALDKMTRDLLTAPRQAVDLELEPAAVGVLRRSESAI